MTLLSDAKTAERPYPGADGVAVVPDAVLAQAWPRRSPRVMLGVAVIERWVVALRRTLPAGQAGRAVPVPVAARP